MHIRESIFTFSFSAFQQSKNPVPFIKKYSPHKISIFIYLKTGQIYTSSFEPDRIIEGAAKRGRPNQPIASKTVLGWLLSGNTPGAVAATSVMSSLHICSNCDVDKTLQNFWLQEEMPEAQPLTKEKQECEKHFAETHSRNEEGRFVLRLPFKGQRPTPDDGLSDSYCQTDGVSN